MWDKGNITYNNDILYTYIEVETNETYTYAI